MAKIITFGEIMLRLNPPGYLRLVQAETLEASYAGGEANVAVSLANYGHQAAFISKVPEHDVGQCAVNALRRYGVDTSLMLRGGERLGLYYVEKGASQRASKVIYDRGGAAFAQSTRSEYDWSQLLEGAQWFHFTGITPALGGELPDICLDAVQACRNKGIPVSCDLNYRAKLWSREKARQVMTKLMPYVTVCIANEEDAADVFGIVSSGTNVQGGKICHEGYVDVARQLQAQFGFQAVAITLRSSLSANDNDWAGMLYAKNRAYFSPSYHMHIVDRVGGGDSFGGGLIHGLISGRPPQQAIDFAVAASCLKHSIEQDFNHVSEKEVMALVNGNASGRVQR